LLNCGFFLDLLLGPEPPVASVSVDDVRDVVNVSSAEVPDAKVLKMVKRAEVMLELETSREIDYISCTDAKKKSEWLYFSLKWFLFFPMNGEVIKIVRWVTKRT
jgi:hypothetical protein